MTVYLSPIGNSPQTSTSGAPLAGGQVFTYQAGTNTPAATYTDNTGGTPQANPIVLNTYGLPASPIWLPVGQAIKFVVKDAQNNIIRTVDNVVGIDDPVPITQSQKSSIPAFSAYQSVSQTLSTGVPTKVQLQTKEYDTAGAFDNGVYRFQPQIPGYYQINGAVVAGGNALYCAIYKNGSEYKRGAQGTLSTAPVSSQVFLNGSTDYVELYVFQGSGLNQNTTAGMVSTYFNGVLSRAA